MWRPAISSVRVQETVVVEQKIMVPYGIKGTVENIQAGEFTVEEVVCSVKKRTDLLQI